MTLATQRLTEALQELVENPVDLQAYTAHITDPPLVIEQTQVEFPEEVSRYLAEARQYFELTRASSVGSY